MRQRWDKFRQASRKVHHLSPGFHWKPGIFLYVSGFVLLCSSALVQPPRIVGGCSGRSVCAVWLVAENHCIR